MLHGIFLLTMILPMVWFLKNIFYWSCYYSCPIFPLHPAHPLPPTFPPPFSSCPWVIHISSLASTFPILFLTSPYFLPTIYATYSLYLSPLSPSPTPLLITLHVGRVILCDLGFCDSVPALVVCLVCFRFCFRYGC